MKDEILILAQTIWGEARGESLTGKVAVANVILNRAKSKVRWWGNDIISVCKAPWQFSCWNKNDPNRKKLESPETYGKPEVWQDCLTVAGLAGLGLLVDETRGSTHYYSCSMKTPPKWVNKMPFIVSIGNHKFYKETLEDFRKDWGGGVELKKEEL